MAKVFTFDVSAPANATAPTGGAAAIRLLKDAIHERANQDHYWEKSAFTADVDNVGYHRKATLMKLAADPTAVTDMGIIYTKDVSGVPELFFIDEASNPIQLTSGGAINVSAAFVSGDLLLTTRTGAISGWTDKSTIYADKFLRVSATAGTTGDGSGSVDSHILTVAEMPAHTHTVSNMVGVDSSNDTAQPTGGVWNEFTKTSSSTGGGSGHTHTITAYAPAYISVRCYQRD